MQRREFLQTSAVAAAGMWIAPGQGAGAQEEVAPSEQLNVALIGVGLQGRALINAGLQIPGIRFRAICDIWEYARGYGQRYLKKYGHEAPAYADYREMLDTEKDLDAVLVASPDFAHAEQTNACLQAGLHVYCEPMMAHTLDGARSMVQTMKQTGKLLQIGYQRRSNPRYRHVAEKLLGEADLPERLTHVNLQWVFPWNEDIGWPRRFEIPEATLNQYGYANMHEFRNWLWYPQYCAGPFPAFVSQQLDVCDWFLGTPPSSVMASGSAEHYEKRPSLDNVMAVYEYPTEDGVVRAFSQMLTTTSANGQRHFEHFLGEEGSIKISENPKWTAIYREDLAADWDEWVRANYVVKPKSAADKPATDGTEAEESAPVETYEMPVVLDQPLHQPHLENFVNAIRGQAKLNCPADVAYRSQVAALKAVEAVKAKQTLAIDGL